MFKKIKLLRGFQEIQPIYELAVKNNCVICGGYARYCGSPLPTQRVKLATDVDIFPKSMDAYDSILKDLLDMGYEIRHENHISTTFKPTRKGKRKLEHIPTPQIIKPLIEGKIVTLGTVEEILENFDFTIVRAAILSPTELLVDEDFEKDEKSLVLRLKNIHCPISSLLRCCKYASKGYFMRPIEALKLFQDWTNRGVVYQGQIADLFLKSMNGPGKPGGITREEIDELEALLRID